LDYVSAILPAFAKGFGAAAFALRFALNGRWRAKAKFETWLLM